MLSKRVKIAIIVLVIIITLVGLYLILNKGDELSFKKMDFSQGSLNLDALEKANTFENIKLNPFSNLTS